MSSHSLLLVIALLSIIGVGGVAVSPAEKKAAAKPHLVRRWLRPAEWDGHVPPSIQIGSSPGVLLQDVFFPAGTPSDDTAEVSPNSEGTVKYSGKQLAAAQEDSLSLESTTTSMPVNSTDGLMSSMAKAEEYPWTAMGLGAGVAMIVMIIVSKVSECVGQARPCQSTPEDVLQAELDQARQKAMKLQEEINIMRGIEPESAAAAGATGPVAETYEELMGELASHARRPDEAIKGMAKTKEVQALLQSSKRVADVAEKEAKELKGKISTFGKEITTDFVGKLQKALDNPDLPKELRTDTTGALADDIGTWFDSVDGGEANGTITRAEEFLPPPLAIMIGGIMARTQIVAQQAAADSKVTCHSILFAIAVALIIVDINKPCREPALMAWMFGLCAFCTVSVMINSAVGARCAAYVTADDLDYEETMRTAPTATGEPMMDTWYAFQHNRGSFLNMLFRLRELEASWISKVAVILSVAGFCWDIYAVYVATFDVIVLETQCSQRNVLRFVDAYATLTLALFLYQVFQVLNYVLYLLRGHNWFIAMVIGNVKIIDYEWFYGVPVLMTLVRAFWVRDATTMLTLMEYENQKKIGELEEQVSKDQVRIAKEKRDIERLREMIGDAKQLDERWLQAYHDKVGRDVAKMGGPLLALAGNMPNAEELAKLQQQAAEAAQGVDVAGWQQAASEAKNAASEAAQQGMASAQAQMTPEMQAQLASAQAQGAAAAQSAVDTAQAQLTPEMRAKMASAQAQGAEAAQSAQASTQEVLDAQPKKRDSK